MKFEEYREQTKRTLPDLGSVIFNSIHMTLGLGSEIVELFEALDKDDAVNIGEELSDKLWYAANYCNIHGIIVNPELTQGTIEIDYLQFDNLLHDMIRHISMLQDFDKKLLAYGKEVSLEDRSSKINLLISFIIEAMGCIGLDAEVCMRNNINKLRTRYPDKFDSEKAINRDLEAERKQLEKE
jgi:hypothetical protein